MAMISAQLQPALHSIYVSLLSAIQLGSLEIADYVAEFVARHDQAVTWAIITAALMPVVLDLVYGIPCSFSSVT
ncbi:MAG: hypothetical protein Q9174_005077, partial [Haloplaca sp. 1 TL-2023]